MRLLILLLAITMSMFTHGQSSVEVNDNMLKELWESHIVPIRQLDEKTIIDQTHFPLKGEWFWEYQADYEQRGEIWNERQAFEMHLSDIFYEDMRKGLDNYSWKDLENIEGENGQKLRLVASYTEEIEFNYVEFAYALEFEFLEGKWWLIAIHFIG